MERKNSMAVNIQTYNSIGRLPEVVSLVYPKNYIFSVTEDDYTLGYKDRFFVQKINSTIVIEVNETNYNEISELIFKKIFLTWSLVGPEKNVIKNGKLYEFGLYEINKNAVFEAKKVIPNINGIISDYTQYGRFIKS
jgi:hypothetical protein